MRKTSILMASVAAVALSAGVARAQDSQLEQRVSALEAELQNSEMRQAADHSQLGTIGSASGWWNNTSISGRMYFDFTNIENKVAGVKSGTNNGVNFDIKRFYVGIDHKFNDTFSGDITTDFTYDSGVGASQIYIKKAYLDAKLDDALDIRLGSTDLPWVPFAEGLYGNRFIENTLIDRAGFGTSADWGIHASGKLAGGLLNYAIAVVNGAGYKKAGLRTDSMDFEGRVNLAYQGFTLGVGGYSGNLGTQFGTTVMHTANRFNAIAAYSSGPFNVGFEYFTATNWKNVTSVATDKAEGYSGFASYTFAPMWSVFGRYDLVKPNQTTAPTKEDNYFNVGVTYSPTKIVDLSLVYKRDEVSTGSVTNSTTDEIGMFGRLRW